MSYDWNKTIDAVSYTGPKEYIFYGGLASRFGGDWWVAYCANQEEFDAQMDTAWERACEIYDIYEPGRAWEEALEEAEDNIEEAEQILADERDSWLKYFAGEATLANKQKMKDCRGDPLE